MCIRDRTYSITEAMEIIQSVKSEKFDESIDISVKLGVDPNKSDQNVRGAVTLPNSLGKEVKVAVFADGDHASQAEKAGGGLREFIYAIVESAPFQKRRRQPQD